VKNAVCIFINLLWLELVFLNYLKDVFLNDEAGHPMDAIIFEPSGLRDKVTTSIVDAAASSAEKIISSEGITVAWDTTEPKQSQAANPYMQNVTKLLNDKVSPPLDALADTEIMNQVPEARDRNLGKLMQDAKIEVLKKIFDKVDGSIVEMICGGGRPAKLSAIGVESLQNDISKLMECKAQAGDGRKKSSDSFMKSNQLCKIVLEKVYNETSPDYGDVEAADVKRFLTKYKDSIVVKTTMGGFFGGGEEKADKAALQTAIGKL